MSKLKTPLLSLGATGTVADSLTFTRRRRTDIVQEKPIPSDPMTLPQMYQRWDYQDGISYWQTLTNAQKQVYKSAGSRRHMTGFAYFMHWYLKNLPDLAGRWRLDEGSGAIAYDSSKNANHGIYIGTTPTTGIINGGRLFDGLNDNIPCGSDPSLLSPALGTVEAWVKGAGAILAADDKDTTAQDELHIIAQAPNSRLHIITRIGGAGTYYLKTDNGSLDTTIWNLVHVWSDGSTIYVSINTVDQALGVVWGANDGSWFGDIPLLDSFHIGCIIRNNVKGSFFDGDQDNVVAYNRVLSLQDRQRHYARAYP